MSYADEIWANTLSYIKQEITEVGFKTWFSSINRVEKKGSSFIIFVPTDFNKEILQTRYLPLIKNSLLVASNEDLLIDILVEGEASHQPMAAKQTSSAEIYNNLNPKYTFDTFVVGSSNSLAHAASVAVAESPSKKYNPLFIYGGVGLGKTHLSHAIGHYILNNNPNAKVCYVTMDKFLDEFINSIKDKNTESFKYKYRTVDVLIIDDIQFIMKKESTQEEFFHTFNELYQADKQIIITSDRPPREIKTLEERLRSRFESGLICDIQSPDIETRIAIISNITKEHNTDIPQEIITYVAENIKSNIRELEGALNRIFALSELSKREINMDLAREALKDYLIGSKTRIINCDTVINEVTRYFDLGPDELKSKLKTKDLSFYRQIAMYICRELTELSLPKIGEEFGGRDHTTVMHAIKKITEQQKNNLTLKNTIHEIISNIKEG